MKIEGETGVMLPQAKECQEPPGVGKDQEGFSLRDFSGSTALRTPCC